MGDYMKDNNETKKELTLQDVIINQTVGVDRLELAVEDQTRRMEESISRNSKKIVSEISSSAGSGSGMPISFSNPYEHVLRNIQDEIEGMKFVIWWVFGAIALIGFVLIIVVMNIATALTHFENGSYIAPATESSDSEPSTLTEEATSPQTDDQSHPQS